MLAAAAVLALAARGSFGRLRGSFRRIAVVGAFGLGIQSWLLAYAMTHVGGALPALVLGLEPIVIGLAGSLVVREHVSAPPLPAFAVGLAGEAMIAGFVTAGWASARSCRSRRWRSSSCCSRPTASRCASSRRCRRPRSCAWPRWAAPSRSCRSWSSSWCAATRCRPSTRGRLARSCSRRSSPPGLGSLAWAAVLSRVRAAVAALGLYLVPLGGAVASHLALDEPLYARHAVGARS